MPRCSTVSSLAAPSMKPLPMAATCCLRNWHLRSVLTKALSCASIISTRPALRSLASTSLPVMSMPFTLLMATRKTTVQTSSRQQGHSVLDRALTGSISEVIKRFDPREGHCHVPPSPEPKRYDGAEAMLPQPRPLIEILAEVPDFRQPRGQRHPL